jgi:GNAT superfamily N-acetyltransferase
MRPLPQPHARFAGTPGLTWRAVARHELPDYCRAEAAGFLSRNATPEMHQDLTARTYQSLTHLWDNDPNFTILAAKHPEKGWVTAATVVNRTVALPRLPEVEPTGHVYGVFVHPQFHRQGLAKQAMARITEKAKALGYRRLSLDTTNPVALQLYQKLGFKVVKPQTPEFKAWATSAPIETKVLMEKKLYA